MNSLTIHHTRDPHADRSLPDPHQDIFSRTVLGFWVYLMTDCILFLSLFISYAVLHGNTFAGPSTHQLFELHTAFIETMVLLSSSVTCGLSLLSSLQGDKRKLLLWLLATFLLGALFLSVELHEFYQLVHRGASWRRSAFLSSFFTLVGTHGLHVTVGLCWLLFNAMQVARKGICTTTFRRLVLFSMFWHFLDLIWIFVYTFVYLMGVV